AAPYPAHRAAPVRRVPPGRRARCHAHPLGQGARPVRAARRAPPDGRQRPDQRLRPRPRTRHPGQGRHPHRDVAVVVLPALRPGTAPRPQHRRTRPGTRAGGRLRTPRHVSRRVRGPRLPHWLRAGRLPRDGSRLRGAPAGWPGRRLTAARADLHPRDQGCLRRARRERLVRASRRHRGRRRRCATACPHHAGLRPRRGHGARARHPAGRHQARAGATAGRHDRARRRGAHPRLVAVLARRPLAAGQRPAVVRQAVRARLADLTGERLGPHQRRPAAAASPGRGPAHPRALRRGVRAAHRPAVRGAGGDL
ncbi:MAG: Phosphoribosylaminoimidazole-succinocarboxamide synthase, partial [uncultured Nocardioidaceae bacterium]